MIYFSTLQGLTVPEGVVTQIADASGRVLWSAAPPFVPIVDFGEVTTQATANGAGYYMAMVTLPAVPSGFDTCTHALVDGTAYAVTYDVQEIPSALHIYTPVSDCPLVTLNTADGMSYTLLFKEFGTYTVQLGLVIPEGHALLTLETSETKHTDVVIDGIEYSVDTTLVVPIGKVVSLRTTNDSGREDSYISINGTWVCSGTTTLNYEYVVVGNATICTYYSNDSRNDTYGYIEITEN